MTKILWGFLWCVLVSHRVRFLSSVDAQVALQGLQVAEAGAAGVTRVRFLPRVDQNVGPQMGDLTPEQTCSEV